MQYVRSLGGSVSKTWNSINPATLSGAIDVIVVEQEDGSLACSPFHVRFGKFSLLRPYEKKVEFKVNNAKQDLAMKLGEGGEAFFVFETSNEIPASLQTSPIVSPATSPSGLAVQDVSSTPTLQEPEFLDLAADRHADSKADAVSQARPAISDGRRAQSEYGVGELTPLSSSPEKETIPQSTNLIEDSTARRGFLLQRSTSTELVPLTTRSTDSIAAGPISIQHNRAQSSTSLGLPASLATERSSSPPPPPLSATEAFNRAISLSKKLSGSNIPTQLNDSGDLMLDIKGYKSSEDEALRAELIARRILAEELEGNYNIGALIGADEQGNLWIYSSEEAKEAAGRKAGLQKLAQGAEFNDSASDLGYHSDEGGTRSTARMPKHQRTHSDSVRTGLVTPPHTPPADAHASGDPNRNYAKTLRLTSDQLKILNLKPGANTMSFGVNRATCHAHMYYWTHDVPIVISDIDGTITKSDALGHVLNMIGRDWTHIGVAKLYSDIVANGYNILYLTSRSVGQADTTRAYLNGVLQEGFKLPKGPVIMSPDRTIAALRREIYLRKPEVFKMACLRDIMTLFGYKKSPFYAGFGNRFTDALSYRSVNIPSTRIFTINSNAEVSLDLLTLTKYKSSYVSMREVVDHFFPPVGLLINGGDEEFTDYNYWRDAPLEVEDILESESEGDDEEIRSKYRHSIRSEDEGSEGLDDDDPIGDMEESYFSRGSADEREELVDSILESVEAAGVVIEETLAEPTSGSPPSTIIDIDPVTPDPAPSPTTQEHPSKIRIMTNPGIGTPRNQNPGLD